MKTNQIHYMIIFFIGMFVLLSEIGANADQVLLEHFDSASDLTNNGWVLNTSNVANWTSSYQDSTFIVTSIRPNTVREYAYVQYYKDIDPIAGDFTFTVSLGWNEEWTLTKTHSIMTNLMSGSNYISQCGYHDGYHDKSGSLKSILYEDGNPTWEYPLYENASGLGSAVITITRVDGLVTVNSIGDGITQTLSVYNNDPLTRVRIDIASWWLNTSDDLYGDLYYDELSLTTPASGTAIPEPATILLFIVGAIRFIRIKK